MVDELTSGGREPLSREDAETLLEWADELGIEGARDDSGTGHWVGGDHIHIPQNGVTEHIPVE